MKTILIVCAATMLLSVSFSVYADPPDPTPGATKPVREQNLDENEWIAVHEQGTATVNVTNTPNVNVTNEIQAEITSGTVEAELTGGEIDVNVVSAPGRYQLVGFTTETFDGADGVLTMTQGCQVEFGEHARMCNTVEIMETVNIPSSVMARSTTYAWVRPVLVPGSFYDTDASGLSTEGPSGSWLLHLSCKGWRFHSVLGVSLTGMTVRGGYRAGGFSLDDCPSHREVACCSNVP